MRKRGAKIKHRLVIKPLGCKASTFEFAARAALVALEAGAATQDHLANCYVLADLSQRIGGAQHIMVHAETIKRLCEELHATALIGHPCEKYGCSDLQYAAMRASVDVLIGFIHEQRNMTVAYHVLETLKGL